MNFVFLLIGAVLTWFLIGYVNIIARCAKCCCNERGFSGVLELIVATVVMMFVFPVNICEFLEITSEKQQESKTSVSDDDEGWL